MSIKDIFTIIDIYDEAQPGPRAAVELASRGDAHVTGLAIAMEPVAPGFFVSSIPADYIVGAVEEAQRQATAAANRFREAANASGISHEARTATVLAGATAPLLAQAYLSDLVVITQEESDQPEPMRETLIEAVLFESGVPLMIVPKAWRRGIALDRVMIAWDGSARAARAVHSALPLLLLAGRIEVTIVATNKVWPGEAGADVATYLARHGLDVEINTIACEENDVAATLIRHSRKIEANLAVMGAYGHSRLRQFILGGSTRTMLEKMAVPTVMAH